ncbi:hypothetical protein ABZ383_30510 [Streptomyces sp. NPDC005900]|uniref:hypothetical protein n=1 Tax=Streptomyces sp. NPDC005900 TaxID=3154569 RepID=UPI0033FE0DA7
MGSDLTYKALRAKVTQLEKKVSRNADDIQEAAKVIEEEATETRRESDQLAAKSVDKDSVADSLEFSKIILGVSDGIVSYAAKGKDTARRARAVNAQAHTTHGGFQEAFDRSDIDGLENVSRDWFTQE